MLSYARSRAALIGEGAAGSVINTLAMGEQRAIFDGACWGLPDAEHEQALNDVRAYTDAGAQHWVDRGERLAPDRLYAVCGRFDDELAFVDALSRTLVRLFELWRVEVWCAAPSLKLPWLYSRNVHPPVRSSLEALWASLGVGDDGDKAVQDSALWVLRGDLSSLDVFARAWFWLARCAAEIPQVYVTQPGAPWALTLCRYGVLHLSATSALDASLDGDVERAGFERLARCGSLFGQGAVAGRALLVRDE